MSNNLFASITAQGQDYPVYLRSDVTSDPPVIAFNTFADLSCQTPTAVWIDVSAGSTTVHHNIVESSCTNDLFLPGQPVLLRNNLLIYGVGGLIVPFIGIKIIDLLLNAF